MSERFEDMTVLDLRKYAREHHIQLPAGINKQGIVEKLRAAQTVDDAPAGARAEAREPAAAGRARTAFIVSDDNEGDEDDYRMPQRAPQQNLYTHKPAPAPQAEPARAPASGRQDVLSSISSKAPAFNIDGVRAWHNPRTFQQNAPYGANAQGGRAPYKSGYAPAQDQRAPARQGEQPAPGPQAEGPRHAAPAEEAHSPRGAENPYLRDYASAQKISLPELLAEGEFEQTEGVLVLNGDGSGMLTGVKRNTGLNIYVSHTQVRRFSLMEGDRISGKVKGTQDGAGMKLMVYIESVNGLPVSELKARVPFFSLPVSGAERKLPVDASLLPAQLSRKTLCIGQRIMIVPSGAFDTGALAAALTAKQAADCVLFVCGRSPEEVQRLADAPGCAFVAADMGAPAPEQLRAASLALSRAQRIAESGRHAVLVADSLSWLDELARAVNAPLFVQSLFSCGRALKNGGSLTVIGLTDPDSPVSVRGLSAEWREE